MTIPTVAIDETSPAGNTQIASGDNRFREFKVQVREIGEVDHIHPSSGQDADAGKHKKCSFIEQADLGTGAEGKPILGAQTVSGKAELVFTDEDDNDVQLTDNGTILPTSLGTTLSDWAAVLALIYPVGSIYFNATDDTNPGTLLGFGTWVAFGAGKFPVGYDSGDTDFDAAEETGGAKTHTLTTDEMPAHTHSVSLPTVNNNSAAGTANAAVEGQSNNDSIAMTSGSAGGGSAHNNLPPYITVFMWKRTA